MTTRMWRWLGIAAGLALVSAGGAQSARAVAPANTAPPAISGTAQEGQTLAASSGSWSGSTPMSFAYRWQRCNPSGGGCSNISGANGQAYKLVGPDAGRTIRVSVTATNGSGSANAVSGPTGVVAGQQPANTSPPTISGAAREGDTLTAYNGSWQYHPTSFSYQWLRCNASGSGCKEVGTGRHTYRLDSGDIGATIRVEVRAGNTFGSNPATSAPTALVVSRSPRPANTTPPTIGGTPQDGQTLVASVGAWTNAPTRFAYRWSRCDAGGNRCGNLGSGSSQRLTSADVGHTIRVTVWAANRYGTSAGATSVPTAAVAAALPAGAIKLSTGEISIPVSQVALPSLLVISGVSFVPARVTSRQAFVGRFRVTDTRGYVIRDALVYAIGLPYGWVRNAPEVVTGTDGWAQITFLPTTQMPLHHASVVFFVRARKPGDNLLTGVSTRRLVQVRIG
jgi:hypothetical protein